MKVGFAQINPTIGDHAGNTELLLSSYEELVAEGADLIVAPELALSGYPPQDLVFKQGYVAQEQAYLKKLAAHIGSVPFLVGFVEWNAPDLPGPPFRNAAALLQSGAVSAIAAKTRLPTYDVFDEARYFAPAEQVTAVCVGSCRVGITICEDIWAEAYLDRRYPKDPLAELAQLGCRLVVNLSASPYHLGKPKRRLEMLRAVARKHQMSIAYCNAVGGNDELIFDGFSLGVHPDGSAVALPGFRPTNQVVDFSMLPQTEPIFFEEAEELAEALKLGVRDYMQKCGFQTAVLGLSGGIDSAVTACLAVAAVGAQNVTGIAMPSRYSSAGSIDDATSLARNLGIAFVTHPIEPAFGVVKDSFNEVFAQRPEDATEENLQSRLRGLTLMAYSNKFGHLLLTTGNKSELAVGYCTLYGDMCGGLAVISDLPKGRVYDLARWWNRNGEIIPLATLDKPPSAELRPDQKDQDTLPPYEILDEILRLTVEAHCSVPEIVAAGFDEEIVKWVVAKVRLNEYKRQQAAPGLRVTSKAFGSGRRMPIAQRYSG